MMVYMIVYTIIGIILMMVFGVPKFWGDNSTKLQGIILDFVSFVFLWPVIVVLFILVGRS